MSLNELLIGTPAGKPWSDIVVHSVLAGSLALSAQPAQIRLGASTQSIADSTATTVTYWTTSVVDVGGITYNSGVFTVPSAGLYAVNACVEFDFNATGNRGLWVRVGSTNGSNTLQPALAAGGNAMSVASVVSVAAGGTIAIQVYQNSSGALDIVNAFASSSVSVYKLS